MRLQKGRVLPFRATWASNSGRKHSPRSGMGKPAPFHMPRCMPATKNGTDPISSILMLTDAFEGVLISCGCMHSGEAEAEAAFSPGGARHQCNLEFLIRTFQAGLPLYQGEDQKFHMAAVQDSHRQKSLHWRFFFSPRHPIVIFFNLTSNSIVKQCVWLVCPFCWVLLMGGVLGLMVYAMLDQLK